MPEEKEFSPLDGPTNVILEEKLATQLPKLTDEQNIIISMAQDVFTSEATVNNPYKIKVQQQLATARDPLDMNPKSEKIGYLDEFGYLVEWNKIKDKEGKDIMATHALGEATNFTAIAVVALASGNYRQDSWEVQNANMHISKFIDVLEHKSWGNMDEHGETHPIRHQAWVEYYGDAQVRDRPMSKDSFGQIVLACYYAYTCPNSSSQVRQQAQSLLSKWIKYLSRHQWRLHSNYIPKEFEASDKKFDNLFEDERHQKKIMSFGQETYLLYPHELWALRNCAIEIAVPHEIVLPPADFSTTVNATFFEPFLEDLIKNSGDAVDYLYDRLQYRKKWSLDLVPGWKKSRITGTLSIGAFGPLSKKQVRDMFKAVVRDSLISAFTFHQKIDGIFDSIMRPLAQFLYAPEITQIVRDLIDQVCPWLDFTVLVELMDFVLALEITKQTYKESNSA
ncbi:hypothetical protein LTR84_009115 [Exophiala bonariae]|uniref:Uncharacterized protein n=1 Tax=Exophiala bonariae TaxID=1690606 RepID=A0AAV9MY55_9EURO|nr:hypothetical protein LTR84_009115 [Exophiala bonariae]